MNISKDISVYVLWKYLPIEDILKYCKTNKEFHTVCNDPEIWRYLLKRDYKIDSDSTDTKKEYMYEYERKKLIEKHRRLVTSLNDKIVNSRASKEQLLIIIGNNDYFYIIGYKPNIHHMKYNNIIKYNVKSLLSKNYTTIILGFNADQINIAFYKQVIELLEKVFYGQKK